MTPLPWGGVRGCLGGILQQLVGERLELMIHLVWGGIGPGTGTGTGLGLAIGLGNGIRVRIYIGGASFEGLSRTCSRMVFSRVPAWYTRYS